MSEDADLAALASGPMLTPRQRRALAGASGKQRGHAAAPGSGPKGETCGSCRHLARNQMIKTYLKCGLMRQYWTGGGGTDVRAKDTACRLWERPA